MKGFETGTSHPDGIRKKASKKECPAMKGFETLRFCKTRCLAVSVRRNAPL
jgi:hypothetical protein